MDSSVIIAIITSCLSLLTSLGTIFLNHRFDLVKTKKMEFRKRKNEYLLSEIKIIKTAFLQARNNILKIYLDSMTGSLNEKIYVECFKFNIQYETSIYENDLFLSGELLEYIKHGRSLLNDELTRCIDSKDKKQTSSEIYDLYATFNDKCLKYLDDVENLLEKELLN